MDLSRNSGKEKDKKPHTSYYLQWFSSGFCWTRIFMFMCPCEIALRIRRENKSVICIKPLSSWLPTHVVANVHKWEKAKGVNTPRTVSNGGNTIGLWKREKALDNNLPQLCCVLPSAQQINLSASALCLSNLRRIYKHKNENKLKPHTADPIHWFSHYIDIHFFNINIVWRSTYLIYKRYTPERGKARVCTVRDSIWWYVRFF